MNPPNPQMCRAGLAVLALLGLSCASKASSGPGPGQPAPEAEEGAVPIHLPMPPVEAVKKDEEAPAKVGTAVQDDLHTAGGWITTIGKISGDAPVLRYRWMRSGDLLFLTEKGWMIHEGGEAVPISGDPLEEDTFLGEALAGREVQVEGLLQARDD